MKTGITNIPNTQLNQQIDLAGNKEFYIMQYHEVEDTCLWDKSFIEKLDRYLINPVSVSKSEARAIEEFLAHEDSHMKKTPQSSHETQVLETLDKVFYETTKTFMKGY